MIMRERMQLGGRAGRSGGSSGRGFGGGPRFELLLHDGGILEFAESGDERRTLQPKGGAATAGAGHRQCVGAFWTSASGSVRERKERER